MKRLFQWADEYIQESDWKTLAALKFCLCAIGILIGIALPSKGKKPALLGAAAVFIGTYIPLMAKFFRIAARNVCQTGAENED